MNLLHRLVTFNTATDREIDGSRYVAALVTGIRSDAPGKEIVSLTLLPRSKHVQYQDYVKRDTVAGDDEASFTVHEAEDGSNATESLIKVVEGLSKRLTDFEDALTSTPKLPKKPKQPAPADNQPGA